MNRFTTQDHNHNLLLNCGHEFFWGLGIAFHTTYAIVPLFLKQLGAPNAIVASIAGLFSVLIAIPQLISALLSRNLINIKFAVVAVHFLVIPPTFLMGFIYTFMPPMGSGAWVVYYICFILYSLSLGVVFPIWANFMRHITAKKKRGAFFGISFTFNSIGGFVGGLLVKKLYSSGLQFPVNFGVGFFVLFVSITIGTLLFLGYRVKPLERTGEPITSARFRHIVKSILKNHSSFKRYLVARGFFVFQFIAVGLYAVYCQQQFNFNISEAGIFGVINVIAYGSASYTAGKIGDRFGHKFAMVVAMTGHLLAIATVLIASSMTWVYAVFFFLGIGQGAFMPASMNLVYDFAGENDSKIYMALIDSTLAPVTLFVIIVSGIIVDIVSAPFIFIGVGFFLIISLSLLLFTVEDPKNKSFEIPPQPPS